MKSKTFREFFKDRIDGYDGTAIINQEQYNSIISAARYEALTEVAKTVREALDHAIANSESK